jgi:hypothetical protein
MSIDIIHVKVGADATNPSAVFRYLTPLGVSSGLLNSKAGLLGLGAVGASRAGAGFRGRAEGKLSKLDIINKG